MNKTCSKCGTRYPATLDYFYKNNQQKDNLRPECKKCTNISVEKYQQTEQGKQVRKKIEHTKKRVLQKANRHFQKNFNITLEEYSEMSEKQKWGLFPLWKTGIR